MDLYTHDELDAIAAAPKRHHLPGLINEVKRLSAIALAAEQLLGGVGAATKPIVETGLRRTIADTKRSQWPLHTKPLP